MVQQLSSLGPSFNLGASVFLFEPSDNSFDFLALFEV